MLNVTVNRFKGEYAFLSNSYNSPVEIDGITYNNAEAAYLAQQCEDRDLRVQFADLSATSAREFAKNVVPRSDWSVTKYDAMERVVTAKFEQNTELAKKLMDTKELTLVYENSYQDKLWGIYKGQGSNRLGEILMALRKKLIEEEHKKPVTVKCVPFSAIKECSHIVASQLSSDESWRFHIGCYSAEKALGEASSYQRDTLKNTAVFELSKTTAQCKSQHPALAAFYDVTFSEPLAVVTLKDLLSRGKTKHKLDIERD